MTVIPFVRPTALAPGLRIALRRDLRTGLVGAGMVRDWTGDAVDALLTARGLWRDRGHCAPLAIAPAPEVYGDAAAAGTFASHLLSAEFSPRGVDVEVDEAVLAAGSLAGVERLRARGFGVALAARPDCPLPLGQRARGLFTEIALPAPTRLDPFMGLDAEDDRPLARRLHAARAAGLVVTATGVGDMTWGRALAAAGFDRGEF
jgi:hypothetical protein